jgi:acetyl-CoA carboxylase biotin carboxyl carrier protein
MSERAEVVELVTLIDRLEALLERSSLTELEVETEGTTVVLRTAAALAPAAATGAVDAATTEMTGLPGTTPEVETAGPLHALHTVVAPLTGVFYRSPSPGAQPYVREGAQVSAGQVIGLIEAMKLFNEIKSDVTGTVRRLVAADGALVKAREPLIEVEAA